jgi:hypothetical protein
VYQWISNNDKGVCGPACTVAGDTRWCMNSGKMGQQWLQFDWEGVEGRIREELRGAGGDEWLGPWHFGATRITGAFCVRTPIGPMVGLWRRQYALRGYSLLFPLWRNIPSIWGTILTIFWILYYPWWLDYHTLLTGGSMVLSEYRSTTLLQAA